ncbi:HAD family hydrolase [Aggregicoccus sp. 17bor-14]|uniref:HAD hydrolase-like protein n=1 Tax=Myxococcaceae TaxID=31 RepID=UPI00129C3288|nr:MULTISPECIES: HAD hydrolase-like protein [Myxococcaceae]MBF5046286.1 HAD hydrolase-like protein [Simulacricoccus sp. 17bor-14]MRI92008.1 HAD family hydrolase [Aggregicoccus sp. 17bor-14]
MITHVVFDFDGTLADSRAVAIGLYNAVAERKGYGALTPENLAELSALSILERCKRLEVPVYRLPALMLEVSRGYRGAMDRVELQPGVRELLAALRERGLRLVILSSNAEENIRAFLRRQGMEAWVDAVLCSSRIFGKARLLRSLMKSEGLAPEQLVYVGDEHRDVEACREVGVRVIAVRWGFDAESRLREASPDHLASEPAEVAECVGRWSEAHR